MTRAGQAAARAELLGARLFSLPLDVERLCEKLSAEKLADRLQRIIRDAEKVADR